MGDRLQSASPEALQDLRRQFGAQHYIKLPSFFDLALVEGVASEIATAEFEGRTSEGVGSEWLMKPNALGAKLNWQLNAPELIRTIRHVTDCADIGVFGGRVYRIDPASGQSFSWHDDRQFEERRLAISVNLGTQPHSGGVLRIREKRAPETFTEVPNSGPGDAVVFRVADDLEHCVTPVEGAVPRLAFSGWFKAGASYYSSLLRELSKQHA